MQTTRLTDANLVTAPDGSEIRELVATEKGSMVHCTLPPGKTSLAVAHRTADEVWYFISGVGEVWRENDDDEIVVDAEPGLSLSIEVGTHFQFRNTGDENLCFIITTIPPWSGDDEAYRVQDHWPA
ncbi:MAG: cupin domain-containing protein [SAR202 cluster bacterium]|jgi:mannose-6-phosphate isomerase-like protein (cupin superfamily)|nr:cupin domain-containing protein [SAR202 cluster bacterium]MDP6513793.1 cupin domain-containing protein [SAR202 cluster bacterium]|tara:strand:+ start:435 stop:812 length:378 start_codon:yes stop_codon:yes gene_type:complete